MTILTPENAQEEIGKIAGITFRKAQPLALGVFMALYGQGGAGKTLLAAELYKLGKTALADAEGGSDVLEHLQDEPNLDITDIQNYRDFEKFCNAIPKLIEAGYENFIIDNLSEIDDLCETHHGILGGDRDDLKKYNLVKKEIMSKVRFLRNLTRTKHVNIIIICWDSDEKDDRNVLKKDLAFTPAIRKEFPGICTIIGHIDVVSDPTKRRLSFAPSPRSVSKFRRSLNSAAMGVPFEIPYDAETLPLVDVINTIKGRSIWPEKKYEKFAKSTSE